MRSSLLCVAAHQHICGRTRCACRTKLHKERRDTRGGRGAAQGRMRVGERIFAYLDDVYVICRPERVVEIFKILEEEMLAHSQIQLHFGKTQVWNRAGVAPPGINSLTRSARVVKPDFIVWRGDASLPLEQQGVKILGVPVGPEYVRHFLSLKSVEHETLFDTGGLVAPVDVRVTKSNFLNITMHTFGNVSSVSPEVQAVLRQQRTHLPTLSCLVSLVSPVQRGCAVVPIGQAGRIACAW